MPPVADIVIGKSGVWSIVQGENITYTLSYRNQGNVEAGSVTIRDILPLGTTYVTDTSGWVPTITGSGIGGDPYIVTWSIGSLTTTGGRWYNLTLLVGTDTGNTLVNVAEIYTSSSDIDPLWNNRATTTTRIVAPIVDGQINKWGANEIIPGGNIQYGILAYNNGNVTLRDVIIRDTLPAGVTYLNDTSGITPVISGNQITWTIGTVSPGCRKQFNINVRVSGSLSDGDTLVNVAEISSNRPDSTPNNNRDTVTTRVVVPWVNLGISKYGPSEVTSRQNMIYTIGYSYSGNVAATNVTITDTLPPGVSYVGNNSGITPTISGNQVIWALGTITSWGGSFRMTVYVSELAASTTLTNVVEITNSVNERYPANNRATCTTHLVVPSADLRSYKNGPWSIVAGDVITYYIWCVNQGNIPVGDCRIVDTLPLGVTYVSNTEVGPPTINGPILSWSVGTLSVGQQKSFMLTVRVDNSAQGSTTLTNVIELTSNTYEDNLSNNRATCNTHVVSPTTELWVYKSGPGRASVSKEMTYSISYGNWGNSAATGVFLIDTLPPGTAYVSDTSGITPILTGNQVIWSIAGMPSYWSRWFDLVVRVDQGVASTTITNRIEISQLPNETNPANNIAEWRTHVVDPKADLTISKHGTVARPGFNKTYYISYSNIGTDDAQNTTVVDSLPSEVIYLFSTGGGSYDSIAHTVTWHQGTLPPGASGYVQIYVNVPPAVSLGTILVNTVRITTPSAESSYANNVYTESERVVGSVDPNDKLVSPQGYVGQSYLQGVDRGDISYRIRFENQATATANAQLITITDQLDTDLDWSTLQVGEIGVGNGTYTLESFNAGRGSLTFSYDSSIGFLRWYFDFNSEANGLPPNVTSPQGEGYVSFSIKADQGLSSGTEIKNKADIVFDFNPAIETPEVGLTVDLDPPSSSVNPLSPYQANPSFTVNWAGTDAGSGIDNYTVYSCDNGGAYTAWITATSATSAIYPGERGHTYAFYSRATDRAGNEEGAPVVADTATFILHELALTISPTSGDIGTLVAVTGQGYGPGERIKIDFAVTSTVATATANAIGAFESSFTVSNGLTAGSHTVTSTGLVSNRVATARFMFTPAVTPPTPGTTGTITGQTTKADGTPIRGVILLAYSDAGSRRAYTRFYGDYDLPCLPPGTYRVSAFRWGYLPYTQVGVVVTAGGIVSDINLQLTPFTFAGAPAKDGSAPRVGFEQFLSQIGRSYQGEKAIFRLTDGTKIDFDGLMMATLIWNWYKEDEKRGYAVQAGVPKKDSEAPVPVQLKLDLANTALFTGQEFEVKVVAEDVANLLGSRFRLDFDSQVIEPISVSPGELLAGNGGQVNLLTAIEDGRVEIATTVIDGQTMGVSGKGVVAKVKFRAKAATIASKIEIGLCQLRDSEGILISNIQLQESPLLSITRTVKDFTGVYCYPNPTDKREVAFAGPGLPDQFRLRIFNVAGEKVYDKVVTDKKWPGKNDDGKELASGIYIYLLTDNDGHQKMGKIGVVK